MHIDCDVQLKNSTNEFIKYSTLKKLTVWRQKHAVMLVAHSPVQICGNAAFMQTGQVGVAALLSGWKLKSCDAQYQGQVVIMKWGNGVR